MTKSEQSSQEHLATRNNDENIRLFVGIGMDIHIHTGYRLILNITINKYKNR